MLGSPSAPTAQYSLRGHQRLTARLTRRAYGFHTPEKLIAMAMLTRGGFCPVCRDGRRENPPTGTAEDPPNVTAS